MIESTPAATTLSGRLRRFVADERAATAIEYGLICGLIFVVVVGSIRLMAASYYNNFLHPATVAITTP